MRHRREVGAQHLNVRGATCRAANGVQVHLHIGEAQLAEIGGANLNHLKVDPRSAVADRLNIKLRELTISPLLWAVVAEELRNRRESYGLRL
jgi:hypothetical protein